MSTGSTNLFARFHSLTLLRPNDISAQHIPLGEQCEKGVQLGEDLVGHILPSCALLICVTHSRRSVSGWGTWLSRKATARSACFSLPGTTLERALREAATKLEERTPRQALAVALRHHVHHILREPLGRGRAEDKHSQLKTSRSHASVQATQWSCARG